MRLRHLLSIALCLHLTVAAGVYYAGRRAAAPALVGQGGIASFASDGHIYRSQIGALEKTLKEEGVAAWFRAPALAHVRLYSLSFALFSPLFGQNILSAEPLNVIYYLGTLLLIFALGSEAFGEREGLIAAAMWAALFPSFLLHTTQLLRDPLFVVVALALVLVSVRWLTTEYSLPGGLAAGALGGAAAGSLWFIKNTAWWVVLAIMCLGATLSVARQAHRRNLLGGNLAGIALMLAIALGVSYSVTPYFLPKEFWSPDRPPAGAARSPEKIDARGASAASSSADVAAAADPADGRPPGGLFSRVAFMRSQFVKFYPDAGSNLDADVRFGGASDVARYLPRAALVGLCAPFPNMWVRAGERVGAKGRLLGGCETFVIYLVELLALRSLWQRRRQLPVWLLSLIFLIGVTALGMVVVNVGALYRQRYLFWILLVVVAADSVSRILPARFTRTI
ncbi:MAG: hypothetical protein LC802_21730 [Acidobacteria bacterium]|nr:hypothetical protein [Acidobacteriota bacterium]